MGRGYRLPQIGLVGNLLFTISPDICCISCGYRLPQIGLVGNSPFRYHRHKVPSGYRLPQIGLVGNRLTRSGTQTGLKPRLPITSNRISWKHDKHRQCIGYAQHGQVTDYLKSD